MKPALLVIDIQNKWLKSSPGLMLSLEQRIEVINSAIALFRKKGLPIVRVYHVDEAEGPWQGTEEFDFLPSIEVLETDARVIKNYPNAFNRTELEDVLAREEIDSVILCGLSATCCVLATYVGAEDRDLHPFFLRGGVAAGSEEKVRFAEEIFETLSVGALTQIL
ncbi:MAG: cysteine hydrolase [Methanomassiliicoccales archaeon]|nr:cysteine hydrolase [Methanomassiliicoccales archaeon]